jgi:Fe-S-cluster containining protein
MVCKACGFCCTVWIGREGLTDDPRVAKWRSNFLKSVVVDGVRYNVMKSECKYLRGHKCGIYSRRPEMCKTFPFFNDEMVKVWKVIKPDCGLVNDEPKK